MRHTVYSNNPLQKICHFELRIDLQMQLDIPDIHRDVRLECLVFREMIRPPHS